MPASPPVITYNVVASNKVRATFEKLKDAKDEAFAYAQATGRVTDVVKDARQRMSTYTPQKAPPPVES